MLVKSSFNLSSLNWPLLILAHRWVLYAILCVFHVLCPVLMTLMWLMMMISGGNLWWRWILGFIDFVTLENFLVSRGPRNSLETVLYNVHKVGVFHSSGYSYSCFLGTLLFSLRHLKRSVLRYHNFMFIYSVFLNSVKFLLGEFLETPASKSCCSFGRWSISSIS